MRRHAGVSRSRYLALALSTVLGLVLVRAPVGAEQATHVLRVGVLAPQGLHPIESFKERLRELGWIEGRNIRFEYRSPEGDDARQPALAAELVALPVDLILTWATPAALAAKQATATIPIVMGSVGDPVDLGLVSSLARPGGNVTGFSSQNLDLEVKRLELLRELVPHTARIVMVGNTGNPYVDLAIKRVERQAEDAGLKFAPVKMDAVIGIESGLDAVRRAHPDAVLVAAATALYPYRRTIVDFMAANRLPAIYPFDGFAEVDGLITYSTNFDDLFRQAADYADKILRGASPADLPVQQAATFKLIINLKTAKTLGLPVPQSILARADEVID
jgi:putative ABC transport system substrate-binding protein